MSLGNNNATKMHQMHFYTKKNTNANSEMHQNAPNAQMQIKPEFVSFTNKEFTRTTGLKNIWKSVKKEQKIIICY